jgi:hypothetical protein
MIKIINYHLNISCAVQFWVNTASNSSDRAKTSVNQSIWSVISEILLQNIEILSAPALPTRIAAEKIDQAFFPQSSRSFGIRLIGPRLFFIARASRALTAHN